MHVITTEGEALLLGLYAGQVVNNQDPKKLGRIQAIVPGLIEPASPWAFPVGGAHGGGKGGKGGFDVPDVGAAVVMGFFSGDQDHPCYFAGWRGQGEMLSPVSSASVADAASKVRAYETDRYLIVLTEIAGSEEVLIKDKSNGDMISMKPTQMKLKSSTLVTIDAPFTELGSDGLHVVPLVNGVVTGAGIDTFTGATYGVLGSASLKVTAVK